MVDHEYERNRAALYAIAQAAMEVPEAHVRNIKQVADVVSKSAKFLRSFIYARYSMDKREADEWLSIEADVLLQVSVPYSARAINRQANAA